VAAIAACGAGAADAVATERPISAGTTTAETKPTLLSLENTCLPFISRVPGSMPAAIILIRRQVVNEQDGNRGLIQLL